MGGGGGSGRQWRRQRRERRKPGTSAWGRRTSSSFFLAVLRFGVATATATAPHRLSGFGRFDHCRRGSVLQRFGGGRSRRSGGGGRGRGRSGRCGFGSAQTAQAVMRFAEVCERQKLVERARSDQCVGRRQRTHQSTERVEILKHTRINLLTPLTHRKHHTQSAQTCSLLVRR